jgi:hypothetical protein
MRSAHPLTFLVTVLALVTVLLLVPLPLDPLMRNWFALTSTAENFAHPLAFWWLTAQLYPVVRNRIQPASLAYAMTLLLAVVFGAAMEFFQSLVGRDASWSDVRSDALGAMFALALQMRNDASSSGHAPWRISATVIAASLAVAATFPLAWTCTAYVLRWQAFPTLWSPDALFAKRFSYWEQDDFPGLVIHEPVRDWRGYSALQVTIRSLRDSGTEVRIRVHDQRHNFEFLDRFDRAFALTDGRERKLRIPLQDIARAPADRALDITAVQGVIIFQEGRQDAPEFAVSDVSLVP